MSRIVSGEWVERGESVLDYVCVRARVNVCVCLGFLEEDNRNKYSMRSILICAAVF